jgi:hypothetical protein
MKLEKVMKPINIKGFEHYLINEAGTVYSTLSSRKSLLKEPKVLKQYPNKNVGYMQVVLQNSNLGLKAKCFYVHRLVALTYIPNPENKPQVNHIIPNKTLNGVWNLEWVTNRENSLHIYNSGYVTETQYKKLHLDTELVNKGLNHYQIHNNINELKKIWNCNDATIRKIFRDNKIPLISDRLYRKINNNMLTILENEVIEFMKVKGHSHKHNMTKFKSAMKTKHNISVGYGIIMNIKKYVKKNSI